MVEWTGRDKFQAIRVACLYQRFPVLDPVFLFQCYYKICTLDVYKSFVLEQRIEFFYLHVSSRVKTENANIEKSLVLGFRVQLCDVLVCQEVKLDV